MLSKLVLIVCMITLLSSQRSVDCQENNKSRALFFRVSETNDQLNDYFDLSDNRNRAGFEVFYWITNLFIDYFFEPSFSPELMPEKNETVDAFVVRTIEKFELGTNWVAHIKIPFQLYPSLVGLAIGCLVLAFIIPTVGFIVFIYRCCCKKKFNPQDRRMDSFRRKVNTFFIFLILILILLGIVILLFTNQNSSYAVHKLPSIVKKTLSDVDHFKSDELPVFFERLDEKLDEIKKNGAAIAQENKQEIKTIFIEALTESSLIKGFRKVLQDDFKGVKEKVDIIPQNETNVFFQTIKNSTDQKQIIQKIDQLQLLINKFEVLTEFSSSEEKNLEFFSTLPDVNTDNQNKIDMNAMQKLIAPVQSGIRAFKNFTSNFSIKAAATRTEEHVKQFVSYYDYLYVCLIMVCVVMLILFIFNASGLAGTCARRYDSGFNRTCHRGTCANCFLSGVAFYFIFSWIFLCVTVILLVPGIFVRHLVCRPSIFIDESPVSKAFIEPIRNSNNISDDIRISQILYECDKSGNSSTLNRLIKSQANRKLSEHIKNISQPQLELPDLKKVFELFNQQVFFLLDNTRESDLKDIKEKLNFFKMQSNENTTNSVISFVDELIILNKQNIKSDLQNYLQNADNFTLKEELTQHLKKKINKLFVPSVLRIFNENIDDVLIHLPSCKNISDLYKEVTTTGCFEYLDNINTFWVSLLTLTFLHLILIGFATKQADLFRKHFAYNEISEDYHSDEYKEMHTHPSRTNRISEAYQTKTSLITNTPIDAYEMEGFHHKSNQRMFTPNRNNHLGGRSPPPQYRDSRA